MTSKLKYGIPTAAMCALLILMMYSCAQIGSISGGDEDTAAPQLKRSKPDVRESNFDGKKVIIKFDEYYQLDNVDQKFLMSPPHQTTKPKIKTKGKKLIVKFKEDLKTDTTYTLQFFDCIKDFNEGNKIDNFQFVFSTGQVVDTFAIAGQVMDAASLSPEKDILVGIYGEQTNFEDSVVIKHKPDYITRTDTSGHFKIDNIRPGRYKVFALSDINETQRFDLENEKIAFLKTIVETRAERLEKIDSLPAGTILHTGEKGHRILDTLLTDSVIVQNLLYTTPNNLKLYSFEEKHLVQYISERNRDIRHRIKLNFNKTVDDSVLITYVDDTLKSPRMLYDFNYTRDSLIVWMLDTADINNDTLQLRVTFSTLDSLNNPTTETDTISVKFSSKKKVSKDKKETKTADTGIDSLHFRLKTNFSGDFDIKGSIKIDIPLPTSNNDTSMVKLYQIVDTSFADDLNNKITKSIRIDSTHYRVIFKRPILGDIVWYPTIDTIISPDWYTVQYSNTRDTIDITVTDTAMAHRSIFSNLLKYHNAYYLGQIQKIRDSISTNIIDQKIVRYERPSRDSIKILMEKPPTKDIEILPINIDKIADGGIDVVQDGYNVTLLLRDTSALKKDTLALKFNTYDRIVRNRNGKLIDRNFKDTLFAIYKIKFQSVTGTMLKGNDTMVFVFAHPLKNTPKITLENYPQKGAEWYTSSINSKRDTFTIVSSDPVFTDADTLKYILTYPTLNKSEEWITKSDTLSIVREKKTQTNDNGKGGRRRKSDVGMDKQKEKEDAQKNLIPATLKFPLQYNIEADSMNSKNMILKYEFEPGKNYMLEIDDSTFTSIYGTPNLYVSSKAKIRELDYYGQMNIDIQNLGNIERYPDVDDDIPPFENIDTSRTLHKKINPNDTIAVQHTQIQEGQMLICLCSNKGEIKYKQAIKTDSIVKFEYILPGDYKVIIIHDRNLNGQWDTGKYIENSYPERTIEFPKKQTVKSKWTTELTWKL